MRTPRRSLLVASMALAVGLSAAGCGSSSTGSSSALDGVKVEGTDPATAPTVTLAKKPVKATTTSSKVLKEGDGAAVTKDDIASINAIIINGTDGKVIDSTWTSSPAGIDLTAAALFPAIKTQLPGKKVGSRMLIAAPPKDVFGPDGNEQAGLKGTDTVVFLLDILSTVKPLPEAKGAAVEPKAGLPTVEWKGTAEPAVITMPAGVEPPTELVIQPLITGEGAEVADGQTVRVSYTGALWKDGSVFDASAKHEAKSFTFQVGKGAVISGWDKGVKGQKVGSRLLLVVPPAEGYGDKGNGSISGTDTLVFVVDILAAY